MRAKLLALLAVCLLAGCSSAPVDLDPDQQRAAALYLAEYQSSQRQQLQTFTGVYLGGEYQSEFTAFLEGESVVLIEELYDLGAFGRGRIGFYFREGALYLIRKQGQEPGADGALQPQQLLLIFDHKGEVLLSQKRSNEQELTVLQLERAGLVRHAEVLFESVAGRQQAGDYQ